MTEGKVHLRLWWVWQSIFRRLGQTGQAQVSTGSARWEGQGWGARMAIVALKVEASQTYLCSLSAPGFTHRGPVCLGCLHFWGQAQHIRPDSSLKHRKAVLWVQWSWTECVGQTLCVIGESFILLPWERTKKILNMLFILTGFTLKIEAIKGIV